MDEEDAMVGLQGQGRKREYREAILAEWNKKKNQEGCQDDSSSTIPS